MTPTRESVTKAIATLFGGPEAGGQWPNINPILVAAGINRFGRRLVDWAQVQASDKPCMFLVGYHEAHNRSAITGPDKRTVGMMLVIYDDVSDPGVIPSARANDFLDAIDDVLRTAINPLTLLVTLGGVVSHVWVEGDAVISPGDLDKQTVIVYPIRVLLP